MTSLFPILRTSDLPGLVAFYERAFGGTVEYRFEHEGADVYVSLALGAGTLAIGFEPDVARGDAIALWLYVDEVDSAYAAALDAGAGSVVEPADMPWGERVGQVRDPDGNLVHLGAPSS